MTALTLCVVLAASPYQADAQARAILDRFVVAWAKVRTMTYRFEKTERMRDGSVIRSTHDVKLKVPYTLYVRSIAPYAGQEIIYDAERDPRTIIAHPGRFPDVTLRIDVEGSLATRDEHHIATHMGFTYLLSILRRAMGIAMTDPAGEKLLYGGTRTVNGRKVDIVTLVSGARPPLPVRARKGERLFDFAKRVEMDPYFILYNNLAIDALTDELENRDYMVPAYYGARTELAIDQATDLPVRQTTWDAGGRLYERYDFHDVVINPPLTQRDFDPDNPDYDF